MQWIMFLALSAIAAILFNPINNWLTARKATLATSSNSTVASFFGGTFGTYAMLTVAFFSVILVASTVMSFVAGRRAGEVPELRA